tara:strand:- start:85 stop:258 length:174 start_codon:yes stop_codon:yes gene_type:complete
MTDKDIEFYKKAFSEDIRNINNPDWKPTMDPLEWELFWDLQRSGIFLTPEQLRSSIM